MIKAVLNIQVETGTCTLTRICDDLVHGTIVTYKPTGEKLGVWNEVAFSGPSAEVELVVYRHSASSESHTMTWRAMQRAAQLRQSRRCRCLGPCKHLVPQETTLGDVPAPNGVPLCGHTDCE